MTEGDYRRESPRFQGENFYKNLALTEQLQAMAREKKVTPSQLALAWVLARGEDVVPIPGTKHVKYLEENAAAAEIVLTREDLGRLERAVPPTGVAGTRYTEAGMRNVNR